jgi:folate-binding protein YgfZ|tara:strand:- start:204 stop:824 length:621 start_codon:yes stop_codon:yes gene_type:complete
MKIETLNPIKILIYGDERIDFIQNIITNDILNDSKSLYSYILTPQGKILFEIQINFMNDYLEIICSNDQSDLFSYFEKYAKLSDISLQKFRLDIANYGEDYFLNSLKMGRLDTNFLPHSTLIPSEVHDEYINYQKGCFVGQEVVSRIKHRQLQKKNILIFEKIDQNSLNLPNNFDLLIEIKNFLVLRLPKDIEYSNLESELGLKKI